jgi:acyl-CoA thioester hydrolase
LPNHSLTMMCDAFTHNVRVYYEDTDAQGVVYYANYLRFTERARTEMLRELGINQTELAAEDTLFVVCSVAMKLMQSAKLDDALRIVTKLEAMHGASFCLSQEIYREAQLLVHSTVKIATITRNTRPKRIPEKVRARLRAIEGATAM